MDQFPEELTRPPGDTTIPVGYIVHRYPYRTETFLVGEMYWLTRLGMSIAIFPLLSGHDDVQSEQIEALAPTVQSGLAISSHSLKSLLYFLSQSPIRLMNALIKVIRLTYREPRVLVRALVLYPRMVGIARTARDVGIRHIHTHFVWLEAVSASAIRELLGTTYSIEPHAFGLFGRNQKSVRAQLEDADAIVTISEYNRTHIRSLSNVLRSREIAVVHCGVETDRFRPSGGDRNEGPVLLSVGRAVEKKGHEYLIAACRELRNRGYEFKCKIVTGATDHRPGLERLIGDLGLESFVELVGAKNPSEMSGLYRESDLFVLASVVAANGDRDGIPVSLMEAMASGLPVVSTRVSGIPELVTNGVNGLLVDAADPDGLASAMASLLDDPPLGIRMGLAGRTTVEERFDSRQSAEEVERFLIQQLSQS